jgi:hypothetical protein
MTTAETDGLINLINECSQRLGDFLAGLDEQSWSQDSACDGWKVGDVVAHLTLSGETWAGSLTRAVAGDADPPPGQSFLAQGELGSQVIGQAAILFGSGRTWLPGNRASGNRALSGVGDAASARIRSVV